MTADGGDQLAAAVASCRFDPDLADADELLDRYHALTAWADAIARAGAGPVTVVQRFIRDAEIRRGAVAYRFVAGPAWAPTALWPASFARAIADVDPDVVHVHGLMFPGLVRWLRIRLPRRTAIVVQDHGGFGPRLEPVHRLSNRLRYRVGLSAADGFMFTAREQATPWQRAGIIPAAPAVYEVLEASTDMAAWPRSTGGLPGAPALLWVGRLNDNKDPLTALDGLAGAAAALPDAALTLAYGDDSLLPAVHAWIAAHPTLRGRVHLRGRVERAVLPALYDAADVFVLASHREVACFALIEALSFGVTPIVTDIPPFRAITDGGRIGALFPPGDAGALARALTATAAAGDRASRRRLVRAHFEHALAWPAVGARAVAAYRDAISRRRRASASPGEAVPPDRGRDP